jgi:hypothetical protein
MGDREERGKRKRTLRGFDSIPYRGDASWWPDFTGEVAVAVLPGLCSWAAVLGRVAGCDTAAEEGA